MSANISQILPSSSPKVATGSGQSQSSAAGAFQQLVQQAGQAQSAGNSGDAGAAEAAITVNVNSGVAAGDETATSENVLNLIEMLLGGLEESDSEDEDDSATGSDDPEMLQDALDQMNALLSLLGVEPVVPIAQLGSGVAAEGQTVDADAQLLDLKAALQESLLDLQTIVQQGTQKQFGSLNANELIQGQLQAVKTLLDAQLSEGSLQKQTAAATSLEQSSAVQQASDGSDTASTVQAVSLLQRLTAKTSNISVLSATAERQEANTQSNEQNSGTQQQADPVSAFGNALNAQSTARGTTAAASSGTVYVNASQFADTMAEFIVQKFDVVSANGVMKAQLQLTPEHLGKLDLHITVDNGQLTAVFHADSAAAKDMLDNQLSQLKATLQSQGLTVDKLEVWQGEPSAYLSDGREGRREEQQAQQAMSNEQSGSVDSDFEEEMAQQEAIQLLGYGRAINATA